MTPEDDAGAGAAPAPKRKQPRYTPVPETAFKTRVLSFFIAWFIRLYTLTLRVRIHDPRGLAATEGSMIWVYWHNRLLTLPAFYRRWAKHRRACVLTSPSRDGAMVVAIVKRFGIENVRGSSNKRAAQALVECRRRLLNGWDVCITPDGPRGPMYVVAPGVIQLSRLTARPIVPLQVHYSRKWSLKSWDRFQIPWPFSRVTITPLPPVRFPDGSIEEASVRLGEMLGGESVGPPGFEPGTKGL